jgi:RNA polymerase sigma-70 factor, ECF subfamily
MERNAKALNEALGRLADGDRSAFDEVFESTWPLVLRFSQKAVAPADAEDAAQAALMKVFSRAHQYDKGRDALPWILTFAAFECKTVRQRARRRREDFIGESAGELGFSASAQDEYLEADLRARLEGVIARLKPSDQETLLSILNGTQRPAVAPATFRKRLERALDRVRSIWRAEHACES